MTAAHESSIARSQEAGGMVPPPPAPVAIAPVDPLTFTEDAPGFSAETIAILATPTNPDWCETRKVSKDSDRELLFVPWMHYQQILLRAFGPGGYRMVPRAVARQEGNVVTWVGALFVRPPGERKFQFIKEAKGECGMHGGMTMGNAAEGAQSDCLVKCCKGLGIFAELFDPAWRAAWEKNHRGSYEKRKATKAWPTARAGGAPPAGTSSPPSAPASPPTSSAPPADAAGAASSGSPSTPPSQPDTGEAATPEQLEAIKSAVKRLKWKVGYLRIWFDERFGIKAQEPARLLGALTAQQADTAVLLLTAFGTNVYEELLAQQQEKGACR